MIEEPDVFYPIPSEHKEIGWQKFLEIMPTLLEKPRGARREMQLLHRATTSGVELQPYPPNMSSEAAMGLLCLERGEEEMRRTQFAVRLGIFSPEKACLGEILTDTHAAISMPRRGHLRQFGRRSVDGGSWQKVHAAHNKPFFEEAGVVQFLGLATGLEEIFDQLCEQYDRLREENNDADLDTRLRCIIFFQLWGAPVIHPFWDANGRAFGAKLVLDLNRLGFPIDHMPGLGEINEELEYNALDLAGEYFLKAFLGYAGLPLLREEEMVQLIRSSNHYKEYMERFLAGLQKGIDQGIHPSHKPFDRLFREGAYALKLCLSKYGHLPRGFYEQELPGLLQQYADFRQK